MIDADRRAAQARSELALTESAFAELRAQYVEIAVGATDQQGAMGAIVAARILDEVRAKVRAHIDTAEIERAAAEINEESQ